MLLRSFCIYFDLLRPSYVSVAAGCERDRLRDGNGRRRQLCVSPNAMDNGEQFWATTIDLLLVDQPC